MPLAFWLATFRHPGLCVWVWSRTFPGCSPGCRAWPAGSAAPSRPISGLDDLLRRAAETVAIATLGTTLAAVLALPLALLAARPVMPSLWLYQPARACWTPCAAWTASSSR
jgi:phosphonate transport system permease protein